ncbi:Uncharacterized protein dnl_31020 [Desulfonema limicola]|uniref:Uncharacterized protein n=1 Tax=Desulfonema limicola TaxID=45656 RepID=A0A975GH10_9BACT|nr:Uncharacterized protein dnl_31020 [Desulfonema limicola]
MYLCIYLDSKKNRGRAASYPTAPHSPLRAELQHKVPQNYSLRRFAMRRTMKTESVSSSVQPFKKNLLGMPKEI